MLPGGLAPKGVLTVGTGGRFQSDGLSGTPALAQEAARIMAEHGIRDFFVAKKKAAERLGVSDGSAVLPKNTEIETALVEYQRLFGGESHTESLYAQRRAALSANSRTFCSALGS